MPLSFSSHTSKALSGTAIHLADVLIQAEFLLANTKDGLPQSVLLNYEEQLGLAWNLATWSQTQNTVPIQWQPQVNRSLLCETNATSPNNIELLGAEIFNNRTAQFGTL